MSTQKNLKVTLVRSTIATLPKHKATVIGLGLRRMHHTVIVPDNACTRGMINKIDYLLSVEEA
jgi:large subunit ribosomal protein L30